MKNIIHNKYIINGLILLAGLTLGYWWFHPSAKEIHPENTVHQHDVKTIWTCAMHPQIKMDAPGKCPICGMDLIPLNKTTAATNSTAVHFTAEAAALAKIETSVVSRQQPSGSITLYGKVVVDERAVQSQVAHIAGRIDRLMVNFTGETVHRGQPLASIYSPELQVAAQELLVAAASKASQPAIYEAARERLHQWQLTDSQINSIEQSGRAPSSIDVVATTSGVVVARKINNGDYVTQGTQLFDIADLSRLWVMFDAYESDLPAIKVGQTVSFTLQALPGKTFGGKVAFIDPVVDAATRVAKVRIEIGNTSQDIKPQMFATGIINSSVSNAGDQLVIPASAVLWTGKRSIVYVKVAGSDEPAFKMREIELGTALGNSYVVESGLNEGEEIVTQGAFNVDAASQLEGKSSMMNGDVNQVEDNHQASNMLPVIQKETFEVSGNCETCKERIEKAALAVNGVKSAVWTIDTKMLAISYYEASTTIETIRKAIADAGHDNGSYKSDNEIYNNLPDCCKYR